MVDGVKSRTLIESFNQDSSWFFNLLNPEVLKKSCGLFGVMYTVINTDFISLVRKFALNLLLSNLATPLQLTFCVCQNVNSVVKETVGLLLTTIVSVSAVFPKYLQVNSNGIYYILT